MHCVETVEPRTMPVMNVPTLLTLVRLGAIPFVVIAFYVPFDWGRALAAMIFLLAALTDWLDGYLARHWNQTTKFGEFLDPVVDKLLVTTVLVLLVGNGLPYIVIPAAIIVGREIVVSALREWMAEIGKHASVSVNYIGKVKTTVQLVALFMLLWYTPKTPLWWTLIGYACLYVAAGLTLWSMLVYLKAAWSDLTLGQEKQ